MTAQKDDCGECLWLKKKCGSHGGQKLGLKRLFHGEQDPDGAKQAYAFTVNKRQSQAIEIWTKKHDSKAHGCPYRLHRNTGAIGGRYTYEFTGTSIGNCVRLRCACGRGLDLTDYGTW